MRHVEAGCPHLVELSQVVMVERQHELDGLGIDDRPRRRTGDQAEVREQSERLVLRQAVGLGGRSIREGQTRRKRSQRSRR